MRLDAATPTGADTGADTGAVCPECGEPVRPVPPTTPRPAAEPMASWSHLDGEPLCPVIGPHGYRPAYPQFTHSPPPDTPHPDATSPDVTAPHRHTPTDH